MRNVDHVAGCRNARAIGMIDRRQLLALMGAGIGAGLWAERPAFAADPSDWTPAGRARVRLIDAGPQTGGTRLAGLQIELDPDTLTYWRSPGEAGVPPTLDTAGSTNLAAIDLRFPAPARFDEGGAEAIGYKEGVVFPLVLTAQDAAQPIDLRLSLSFAVCAALCLPAQASVALRLTGPGGSEPEAGLVREALAEVPERRAVGASGPLAIEAVTAGETADTALVTVRAEPGVVPALFVEAPEPWYFTADAGTAAAEGRTLFRLRAVARPKAVTRVGVRLTLVAGTHAIDATSDLDVVATKP